MEEGRASVCEIPELVLSLFMSATYSPLEFHCRYIQWKFAHATCQATRKTLISLCLSSLFLSLLYFHFCEIAEAALYPRNAETTRRGDEEARRRGGEK